MGHRGLLQDATMFKIKKTLAFGVGFVFFGTICGGISARQAAAVSNSDSWSNDRELMCERQFAPAAYDVVEAFGHDLRSGFGLEYVPTSVFRGDPDQRSAQLALLVEDLASKSKRLRHNTAYLPSAVARYAAQATEIELYLTFRLAEFFLDERNNHPAFELSPVAEQWLDIWVAGKLNVSQWIWQSGIVDGLKKLVCANIAACVSATLYGVIDGDPIANNGAVYAGASAVALVWTLEQMLIKYLETPAPLRFDPTQIWKPFYTSGMKEHWRRLDSDLGETEPATTLEDLHFLGRQYSKFVYEQLALSGNKIDLSSTTFETPLGQIKSDASGAAQRLGWATAAFHQVLRARKEVFELAIQASFGPKLTQEIAEAINARFNTQLKPHN